MAQTVFSITGMQRVSQKKFSQHDRVEADQLWPGVHFLYSGPLELQPVKRHQTAAVYIDILRMASLITECPLPREENRIFQQDNATIHNARRVKKFVFVFFRKQHWYPSAVLSWSKPNGEYLGMDSKESL